MRTDGYAPIEDYAVIGDGRTAALVARDGAIDWMCLPNIDSPSVFAAILDAGRGGTFLVQPSVPFESTRRYIPDTNVLETTFTTAGGRLRVVDALTLPDKHLEPMRELARSIEGVDGTVPVRWRFAPRFDYGSAAPRWERRDDVPVAISGAEAIALSTWDAGAAAIEDGALGGAFDIAAGGRALLTMSTAYAEPLVLLLAVVDERPQVRRSVARRRAAQRARVEAADLRALRRAGGGADDLAARGDGRRTQLGLPLLLDSRLEFRHRRAARTRVL
jgi:hypothetical protein